MMYEYWFANIKGLSNKQKTHLRGEVSCAEELYYMEETALRKLVQDEKEAEAIMESKKEWKLETEYEKLVKKGAHFYTIYSKDYPERLKEISAPPYALYVKGSLPREDGISVAIVGARQCSSYGESMAKAYAKKLAETDIQIISGMARGIDGISQQSALEAGGKSFGVLGCGVDICYPREHFRLYTQLQEQGGIISEQPLGMQPLKQFFPARNRIISALADVVLVMEAKEQSGSLITADMALEQGKDVYALPGPVTSKLSEGCNRLIKQGAAVLMTPEELLEDLGIFHKNRENFSEKCKILLETTEELVYSCLDFNPKNLNYLLAQTSLNISGLLDILIRLEIKGYIKEVAQNYYVKVK